MVDLVVGVEDGSVRGVGPGSRGVVQGVNDFAGEISDLVGERGDFFLDGTEENVLAEAGKQTRHAKREYQECRGRRGVGDDPPNEDLSLAGLERSGSFDACTGRIRPRSNVDDVHWIDGFIPHELCSLLHGTPAPDLLVGHRDAYQDCNDDQNSNEDAPCEIGNSRQVVEEIRDAVIVRAKGQLLFLRHGKDGPVEGVMERAVDELLDFFKWQANHVVGEVLDLGECRYRGVQLGQIPIQSGRELNLIQAVQRAVDVDCGDFVARLAKHFRNAAKSAREFVEIVGEGVDAGMDIVREALDRRVEKTADILNELQRHVQTSADNESDEAQVGRGQHVDVENNQLFNAGDAEEEHRHQTVDGLLDAISRHFVHSCREVMRHGRHGAAH